MASPSKTLLERLGVAHPIVQAPMAGGPSTPELVAAVSNAGALGSLGAAYLTGPAIREAVAAIRRLSDRPFAINLFVPEREAPDLSRIPAAQARLAPYRAELGLPTPPLPTPLTIPYAEQLDAVLEARPALFSVIFGIPDEGSIRAFRARGTLVAGTATTVAEARLLEQAGVDAVIAQGSEAGGHRGTFAAPFEDAMIGTTALVPQVADAVRLPVLAAGGIMDGRGIAAALALGASAAILGTAFLACAEAGTDASYRRALAESSAGDTAVTRAFSGKPARGLRNRFMEEVGPHAADIAPFPVQNALTRDIRAVAARLGRGDLLSRWAGQGAPMARAMPAGELVATLVRELAEARAQLSR
jgi:nitronate monooxygenase